MKMVTSALPHKEALRTPFLSLVAELHSVAVQVQILGDALIIIHVEGEVKLGLTVSCQLLMICLQQCSGLLIQLSASYLLCDRDFLGSLQVSAQHHGLRWWFVITEAHLQVRI